jgi:hypothetical protein
MARAAPAVMMLAMAAVAGAQLLEGDLAVVIGVGLVKALEFGGDEGVLRHRSGVLGIGVVQKLEDDRRHEAVMAGALAGVTAAMAVRPAMAIRTGVLARRRRGRSAFRALGGSAIGTGMSGAGVAWLFMRGDELGLGHRTVVIGVEPLELAAEAVLITGLHIGLVEDAILVEIEMVEDFRGVSLRLVAGQRGGWSGAVLVAAGLAFALVAAMAGAVASMDPANASAIIRERRVNDVISAILLQCPHCAGKW